MVDEKGTLYYQNEDKKIIIEDYYEKVYEQEKVSKEKIKEYLEKVELPKVPETVKAMLNERISMMELSEAIKRKKNNKTPGPDGLPAEFYKCLQDTLSPSMLEVYNEVLVDEKVPNLWMEANIALIPKEDSDLMQIKNYKPISLVNAGYKIYASIMAQRLKRFLNEFIHPDQNGFLPKVKNSKRMILNTVDYYEAHRGKQMASIFLDAQKAFDNVNWQFMLSQLKFMDFGERFINMIKTIYTAQKNKGNTKIRHPRSE